MPAEETQTVADRKVLLPESLSKSLLVILEIHHADDMKLSYHLDYDKKLVSTDTNSHTERHPAQKKQTEALMCNWI